MLRMHKLVRPIALALLVCSGSACSVGVRNRAYYPYDYPWYYTDYGTYTVVRRPVIVVDGWTNRTFHHRYYRGYRIHRHNSPKVEYSATKGNSTLEVDLIPMGDSTKVEVRARNGGDKYNKEQARELMGRILQHNK